MSLKGLSLERAIFTPSLSGQPGNGDGVLRFGPRKRALTKRDKASEDKKWFKIEDFHNTEGHQTFS